VSFCALVRCARAIHSDVVPLSPMWSDVVIGHNGKNTAVGKMQNCGMWNAEGKMRNGCAESYCGTVGNIQNAENCPVGCRQSDVFSHGVQGYGGGRHINQNIGLGTFVCSTDFINVVQSFNETIKIVS